ncbi:MAG: hypothetical protein IT168_24040 [Bryobacterales bacterium]|nr:hypothetical protein [Bryobacterales bacterium]
MPRYLIVLVLAGLLACGNRADRSEQSRREDDFRKLLHGATLNGRFSSTNSDRISADKYTISSVSKLAGDLWTINTRIQYGDHDVTVPVPVHVAWAADTPVLSLTNAGIPGLGAFTARVLFYGDQYAGTWSSNKGHGGHLFGKLDRAR